jgi:phosphoribosylaminoimidazole-succinocarboxamide synthase
MSVLHETNFNDLPLLHRGKVRDMYGVPGNEEMLLMVATDRISAYDVVMAEPIPGKGKILTQLSTFWFSLLGDVCKNHLISAEVSEYPAICRICGPACWTVDAYRQNQTAAGGVYCAGVSVGFVLEGISVLTGGVRFYPAGGDE